MAIINDLCANMKNIITSNLQGGRRSNNPIGLIFDIDDTILDVNQTPTPNKVTYVSTGNNKNLFLYPGIKCVIDLINFAYNNGYTIILLTARPPISRESTIMNLKLLNVPYNLLMFNEDKGPITFKYNIRKKLMEKYDILFTVGDQMADVNGPPGMLGVKFPAVNDGKYGINYFV
jgi:predicted secreted acid phosphatase